MERVTKTTTDKPMTARRLKIAIDCRIPNPRQGIGTAVMSLASALSQYDGEDQEYVFIVAEEAGPWLQPYLSGPCKLVTRPTSQSTRVKKILAQSRLLRAVWQMTRPTKIAIPLSDGYIESENFDLVHFPTQLAFQTAIPSIYQPWDLQHLHYPQFFSEIDWNTRELLYKAYCAQARFVCLQTMWSKRDIVEKYQLSPEKVVVIPWGSVFDAYQAPSPSERESTRAKYNLPEQFFFYPAATWPHKNHAVILEATHILKRDHNRIVDVFFTGAITEFRPSLDQKARKLGILSQVHFLGFVSQQELQCLFSSATAMIFASMFEGFGLPVLEVFHARTPLICSNATVLPETAQEGALYFAPDDPEELARLMLRCLDEPTLREELIEKGTTVLSRFSMNETAAAFRKLYRIVAGQEQEMSS